MKNQFQILCAVQEARARIAKHVDNVNSLEELNFAVMNDKVIRALIPIVPLRQIINKQANKFA